MGLGGKKLALASIGFAEARGAGAFKDDGLLGVGHHKEGYLDGNVSVRLPDVGAAVKTFLRRREIAEFISGAMAGAMTKAVLAPLETIRTRMVVGVGSKQIFGSLMEIMEHNGWQGLWAGNTINMIHIIPTQAIELGTFECVKWSMTSAQLRWKEDGCPKIQLGGLTIGGLTIELPLHLLSPIAVGGAAAGIVSTLVCHPLEVIKDRLTVNREAYPRNIALAFNKIYRTEGVGGLYAGLCPTLVGMLPYSTCYYFIYETIKTSYCRAHKKKSLSRPELLVIGALSAPNVSHITGMLNGIEQLNGSNYATWKEKLEITMALLNIDYVLLNDPPEAPKENDENYDTLKKDYDVMKLSGMTLIANAL